VEAPFARHGGNGFFQRNIPKKPDMKRVKSAAAYAAMNDLVSGIPIRGWSHYVLSYGNTELTLYRSTAVADLPPRC